MALSSTTNRVSYAGNDSTTAFAYGFYFLADADLVVLLVNNTTGVETTQVITTDYTVSGAGNTAGGTVTMTVAPASGETLVIFRNPALTQGVDLRENDSLPAETVEEALDRQMMISQRTRELTERSLRLSDGFTGSFDLQLPANIDTANSFVRVNSTGDGFEISEGTQSNIVNDEIAADADIEYSKMEALTANRALATDANGEPTPSAVTDTELSYLDGVTSNVQTQLNGKEASGTTATHEALTSTHGVSGDVVGTTDAQTLTNKTLTSPVLNTGVSGTAVLDEDDMASDSDTQLATQQSIKAYVDAKPGGGFNLETDPYAQLSEDGSTGNWVGYDDAAEDAVDLVDGTFDTTFANSATDTSILSGTYQGNFAWTIDGVDRRGEGVARTYTIPEALRGKEVTFTVRYTSSAALSDGDIGVYAYDITNTELMPVYGLEDNKLPASSAGAIQTARFKVYTASDTASIRWGFHRRTNGTTATVFRFSDIQVSDVKLIDSPIITEWQDFTPTGSWTSNTTYSGKYRRVGQQLEGQVLITLSGAPNSTSLIIDTPLGLTVDSSQILKGSQISQNIGLAEFRDSGTRSYVGFVSFSTANEIRVFTYDDIGTYEEFASVNQTIPITWASGDEISVNFKVPITEWANSSAVISASEALNTTAKCRAELSSTQTISTTSNTKVLFDITTFDTVGAFDTSTNEYVIPKTGYYDIKAKLYFNRVTAGDAFSVLIYKNTSTLVSGGFSRQSAATDDSLIAQTSDIVFFQKGDRISVVVDTATDNDYDIIANGVQTYFVIAEQPDFTVYGVYGESIKAQTKFLSDDDTAGGTLSDLTFSNLKIGKWYQVSCQVEYGKTGNGTMSFSAIHNGNTLFRKLLSSAGAEARETSFFREEFQATATTVTFSHNVGGTSTIYGNGGKAETWAKIKQITPELETTEFN